MIRRSPASSSRRISPTSTIRSCWPTCGPRPSGCSGAIARGERIAIHGDYDVDGITSTVMLRRALEGLGGVVDHFVPDRIRDGYGLQTPAVERLAAAGARVIISVDCGIRSIDAALSARDLGVDLIITDHHGPTRRCPSRSR